MFLSKGIIKKSKALEQRIKDMYNWHQFLWKAFPGKENRDFLYRVDSDPGLFTVHMLSKEAPALLPEGEWQTKETGKGFLDHDVYIFRVKTNPTVKKVVRDKDGNRKKNGSRVPLITHEDLTRWIGNKGKELGFQVDPQNLDYTAPHTFIFTKKGMGGKLSAVDFSGVLKVTDKETFKNAYKTGVGPAKSFGFGLMLLKPVILK